MAYNNPRQSIQLTAQEHHAIAQRVIEATAPEGTVWPVQIAGKTGFMAAHNQLAAYRKEADRVRRAKRRVAA